MKKLILGLSVIALTAMACNDNEKKNSEELDTTNDEMAYDSATASDMVATNDEYDTKASEQTITDIAIENENFSTLETAVVSAGLGETLSAEGPYTVFAPTNEAFSKLPEGKLDELTMEENKETLSGLLKYHVVSGKFLAADVKKAIEENNGTYEIATVNGANLTASIDGADIIITDANGNKAKVVQADVEASNGVIHGIDAVVMPKS